MAKYNKTLITCNKILVGNHFVPGSATKNLKRVILSFVTIIIY